MRSPRIFIVSIVFALTLWFYVRLGARVQQILEIPIEVINVREGWGITSDVPSLAKILVESDGKTILGLRYFLESRMVIDLAGNKETSILRVLPKPGDIRIPRNLPVTIVDIQFPDTLELRIEKLVSKKIPIRPDVQVTCETGFVLVGGVFIKPDSIEVRVPKSLTDSIVFLTTETQQFKDLDKDRIFDLKIKMPEKKYVHFLERNVLSSVDIQPLGEIVLENLPVRLLNAPPKVLIAVQPSTFSIRIRGGVDLLSTLNRDSLRGEIDYAKEFNSIQPRLDIYVPRDITWTQVTPARFSLIRLDEK